MTQTNDLIKLKERYARRYGNEYVNIDGKKYVLEVVPTGSLMLDYKTGIGGFPFGAAVEVFAENRIGKSSAIGYPVLGNVQRMGKTTAVIQSEPRFQSEQDIAWAREMGFDPDNSLNFVPDHANQAFDILRDLVFDNACDYIVIDSLGAMGTESSAKKDGKTKAYGISGLVTSVLNDIIPRMHHNNIGLLILNQRRQSGNYNGNILYDSPGGEGLHHQMRMRLQLKPSERYTATIEGDKVLVGRQIKAVFVKNNMSKRADQTATFDFYNIDTEDHPVGIDKKSDVVATGIVTGVIKKTGGFFEHPTFPVNKGGDNKIQGEPAVGQYILENDKVYEQIRSEVLERMVRQELVANAKAKEKLKVAVTAEADE